MLLLSPSEKIDLVALALVGDPVCSLPRGLRSTSIFSNLLVYLCRLWVSRRHAGVGAAF